MQARVNEWVFMKIIATVGCAAKNACQGPISMKANKHANDPMTVTGMRICIVSANALKYFTDEIFSENGKTSF
jgi:hypothetical protein